ncbi:MAG: metallophosphoesterase [Oscillospiraceae bacterium]|nr:metallophosphoesterase [Oscillospiraceae bacterium]
MTPFALIAAGAIAIAAVVLLLFIAYMRREATRVVLETVRLYDGDDGLRVVQLSDIHIKIGGAPPEKIIRMIRDANPHVVMLTGDYIDSPSDAEPFIAWMGELVGALGGIDASRKDSGDGTVGGVSFYLCFGNHDNEAFLRAPSLRREFTRALKRMGVYVMEDRTLSFSHNGKLYAVTGFSDFYYAPHSSIQRALNGTPKGASYHIGISHNPDLAMELRGPRPDLLLLGHFHGGQIWMPFHLEYTCLRKERLCKIGIRRGLHEYGGRRIYISRGIGCVMFPFRLGSRPEITLFLLP